MRLLLAAALAFLILPAHRAAAQEDGPIHAAIANVVATTALTASNSADTDDPQSPAPRHVAFEYSDGTRPARRFTSTRPSRRCRSLPPSSILASRFTTPRRTARRTRTSRSGRASSASTAAQGVTGVWNLVEASKDPNGHKRRLIHGILMLASGAGFAITPMIAPGDRDRLEFGSSSASTHRAVAFTSIGIGTAGYLMMLLGGK